MLSFCKNCFFLVQHSNWEEHKLFISIRFGLKVFGLKSPVYFLNIIYLCFKPAQIFFLCDKTRVLFFHTSVFLSPPLCNIFLTPSFAYSICRTSWLKLEPLSSPVRQGNFTPIFFEFFSFSSYVSFTFPPFTCFLFHFSFPHTFSVKQFPSPCQA